MLEVFITDLQAYNEGYLVGRWFTLPVLEDRLSQVISDVFREGEEACGTEDHEEYFISDFSWGDHELFDVGEYSNLSQINEQLQQLEDKSDHELKAIAFLLSESLATDIDDAISKADDVIIHSNQSMEDIAYDLIQECYNIHELSPIIANHIDYQGIGRDLEMDGNYFEVGNDIYEFVG
jgi:antirestriction protein